MVSIPPSSDTTILKSDRCYYTRLKALTCGTSGLVTPDNVGFEAGALLASIWSKADSPGKPLLVNCSGVVTLSQHALHNVAAVTIGDRLIVFYNCSARFAEEIERELGVGTGDKRSCQHDAERRAIIYGSANVTGFPIKSMIKECAKLDDAHTTGLIRDSFHSNHRLRMERLQSTPLRSSGVYNARHIICEASNFNWIVLRLEEALQQAIPRWDYARHSLLSGSLRACPFAAALAFTSTIARAVEVLDHLGPHPALLEEHDLAGTRSNLEYVYVGDFMIGGTEVKLAANWAAMRRSRVVAAVMLGTLFDEDEYGLNGIRIVSLASLKGLNPKAKFAAI